MKIYHVYALCRSGHHAIINWMGMNAKSPVLFLNGVENNPQFENGNVYDSDSDKYRFHTYRRQVDGNQVVIYVESFIITPFPNKSYLIEDRDLILCTEMLSYVEIDDERYRKIRWIKKRPLDIRRIIILRDPFNNLASVLRLKSAEKTKKMLVLWKEYYRLLKTNPKFYGISYNLWKTSKEYRDGVAKDLSLCTNDYGLDIVSHYGGGSSFDGMDKDGSGSSMDTLSRYEELKNDAKFISYFDKEIKRMALDYFGWTL